MLRRYEKAIEVANMGLERSQNYSSLFSALASAYGHLGRLPEAHGAVEDVLRLSPERTLETSWEAAGYVKNEFTLHYVEGQKLAGMPE
jgi:tetratricopeptide (TPR) repeat protein